MWKQTGIKPKELEELLELPEIFKECWYWFLRLHTKRQSSGMSINGISYTDIKSFFDLLCYQPAQWEIEVIEMFDTVYMKHASEKIEAENRKTRTRSKPSK